MMVSLLLICVQSPLIFTPLFVFVLIQVVVTSIPP